MSATEVIDQFKSLPSEEWWSVFRFLRQELEGTANARRFAEFSLIGSDQKGADVTFAEPAQAEVLRLD